MAEIAGLALGAVGLIPLFNMVIEDLHLIRLGRDFGSDFETCYLLLININFRITRWGQSVGITGDLLDQKALEGLIPEEVRKAAEQNLGQINNLIQSARRQSEDYGSYQDTLEEETKIQRLFERACQKVKGRNKAAQLTQKAKWVIQGKQMFENTIEQISKLVHDLEDLYSGDKKDIKALVLEEMELLGADIAERMVKFMEEMGVEADKALRDVLRDTPQTARSSVVGRDVTMGNLGKGVQNVGPFHGNTLKRD